MLDLKALLAKILNCLTCDLLYSGSFTSGTLTLTSAIANYKSLIFVYQDNDGVLHTQQVITNNASVGDFILDVVRVTSVPYLKNMIININGSVLTSNANRQWASNTPTTGNYVIINKVYGCKGIVANGGGYLTSKFYEIFSHLERWWEYVRFKGVVGEISRYVCNAFVQHKLGWHDGHLKETRLCGARNDLESNNGGGWKQYYRHIASRLATSDRCGMDGSRTKRYVNGCGFEILYQLSEWSVFGLQLWLSVVKQKFKYFWKLYVYNCITLERGCLAC